MTLLVRLLFSALLIFQSYRETHGWATTLLFVLVTLANELNVVVVKRLQGRRSVPS